MGQIVKLKRPFLVTVEETNIYKLEVYADSAFAASKDDKILDSIRGLMTKNPATTTRKINIEEIKKPANGKNEL